MRPEDFALLNPNTKTCPIFRSRRDADLTRQIYSRVPVLKREGEVDGDPWGVTPARNFDLYFAAGEFCSAEELGARGLQRAGNQYVSGVESWLPLYSAKMIDQYDHRAARVVKSSTAEIRQAQPSLLNAVDKEDPDCT